LRPGSSSIRDNMRTSSGVRPLSSMRPLSSYRIKTGLSDSRSNNRLNSARSDIGSRLNSAVSTSSNIRPNTEPIGDVKNDSSNLTVGPALQGNPLKALLARKKPNEQKLIEQISKQINLLITTMFSLNLN
jgi:hypothetical protein